MAPLDMQMRLHRALVTYAGPAASGSPGQFLGTWEPVRPGVYWAFRRPADTWRRSTRKFGYVGLLWLMRDQRRRALRGNAVAHGDPRVLRHIWLFRCRLTTGAGRNANSVTSVSKDLCGTSGVLPLGPSRGALEAALDPLGPPCLALSCLRCGLPDLPPLPDAAGAHRGSSPLGRAAGARRARPSKDNSPRGRAQRNAPRRCLRRAAGPYIRSNWRRKRECMCMV